MRGQPFADVDLGLVARDVAIDLEARLDQCGGRIDLGDLPTIEADASQMRQVFQNLLGNALKFAAQGRPPIVSVIVVDLALPGMTSIEIRDNGIGFDPAHAGRIFEPFERLHGRAEFEGTGIGLAICRRIVERHGGTISANAHPGEGASITMSLPIDADLRRDRLDVVMPDPDGDE
jgi:signal transduction histidine kinase